MISPSAGLELATPLCRTKDRMFKGNASSNTVEGYILFIKVSLNARPVDGNYTLIKQKISTQVLVSNKTPYIVTRNNVEL